MAKCNYICCNVCDDKIIYDAGERIATTFGDKFHGGEFNSQSFGFRSICHRCSIDGGIHFIPEKNSEAHY